MSTLRYSGTVTARITYLEGKQHYRVYLDHPGVGYRKGETVYVGEPALLSCSVDSPEAFDSVFRAAVAFASSEISERCYYDCNGVMVFRSIHAVGRAGLDGKDTPKQVALNASLKGL
jgi:hypothetical protein